jgi:hypothetical protein
MRYNQTCSDSDCSLHYENCGSCKLRILRKKLHSLPFQQASSFFSAIIKDEINESGMITFYEWNHYCSTCIQKQCKLNASHCCGCTIKGCILCNNDDEEEEEVQECSRIMLEKMYTRLCCQCNKTYCSSHLLMGLPRLSQHHDRSFNFDENIKTYCHSCVKYMNK